MTRRRMTALILVVMLGWSTGAAAHDYEPVNPPFPDPRFLDPQVKVTPSDALVGGQTVQVTGRFFGAETTNGILRQCTEDLALCEAETVPFTTGSNGEFNPVGHPLTPDDPPTIPVPFVVRPTFVAAGGTPVDCLATSCVIHAFRTDPLGNVIGKHHINFLAPGAGRYTPLTPARILDTRFGTGGIAAPVGHGATVEVQVAGAGGVPATGVSAVAMNVTVTQPTGDGYLTLYPSGNARPNAANLNFTPGKTVPNLVVVKLGAGGRVAMFNSTGSTHVIYDVAGWYSDDGTGDAGRFEPLVPARILDTRDGTGGGVRLGPGASLELTVAGQGGVPATGAEAAVLNVAVTGTTAQSYLTIFPTGEPQPLAANLNYSGGDTVSNRVMAKLGAGGKVTIYNHAGGTEVVVDVGGWYTGDAQPGVLGTYVAREPARILDTRFGIGGVVGPLGSGAGVDVQVTGQGGIPATGVRGVILNATVTSPAGAGYLTIFPKGAAQPFVSDLNFAPGETRPNLVVVRLGPDGNIVLFTSTQTHVVFDIAGWFS